MSKKIVLLCYLSLLLTSFAGPALAQNQLYYLCGPDEDGCFEGSEEYCACIPYNITHATKPYCLNFDKMECEPLSAVQDCNPAFTYENQGSCLATIFQSEPTPPCKIVTKSFCEEHHTAICQENGNPDSCQTPG